MITNQFLDFKHTNFQISTPTPFEVYPQQAVIAACYYVIVAIHDVQ